MGGITEIASEYCKVCLTQYGPRDRLLLRMEGCLWLCSGHSHKVLHGCLEVIVSSIINCCVLSGYLVNEGARESSSRQAITPARYDGTLATNHNAAIGERGYHNASPP